MTIEAMGPVLPCLCRLVTVFHFGFSEERVFSDVSGISSPDSRVPEPRANLFDHLVLHSQPPMFSWSKFDNRYMYITPEFQTNLYFPSFLPFLELTTWHTHGTVGHS